MPFFHWVAALALPDEIIEPGFVGRGSQLLEVCPEIIQEGFQTSLRFPCTEKVHRLNKASNGHRFPGATGV